MKLVARMWVTMGIAAASITPLAQAQSPATQAGISAPPARHRHHPAPKAELFLGYSRFGTGSNNTVAGNRMVGLNGGSASIAFNLTRDLGLVGDFGGYDDSQLQLTGNGVNQPLVVNSSGTAYTYLFGPRFSFRNDTRFTPFVQVLAGGVHASAVTVSNCAGTGCTPLPVQNSFALTGGGGLDIRLTHHISIRAVQAEYMLTRFADVTTSAGNSQNDLRLSTGLLFGFGGRSLQPPVQLSCSATPDSAFAGDPITVSGTPASLNPKRKAVFTWTSTGGVISGTDASATVNTAGLAPGSYTVSGHVTQGPRLDQQAGCTATFTILPVPPPTVSCSANPTSLMTGDTATISAAAVSPRNRALTYSYAASAGTVTGATPTATLTTSGLAPGDITVTCNVVDDLGRTASATTVVTVTSPPTAAAPQTRDLCAIAFDRDRKRPARVDNEAKACLDDVALQMQRESSGKLVVVGHYGEGETPKLAAERALNVRQYLTEEKGLDAGRIDLRVGAATGRTVADTFVPSGAVFTEGDTTPVDETIHPHGEPYGKPRHNQ